MLGIGGRHLVQQVKHRHPDPFIDAARVDRHEPVDDLEPDETANLVREARVQFLYIMDRALRFVVEAENPRLAGYAAAVAIGLPLCDGIKDYEDIARRTGTGTFSLGGGKQAVSKMVKQFSHENSLPPSPAMKNFESCDAFRVAREQSIEESAA